MTLALGFYLLPEFGVSLIALVVGGIWMLIAGVFLISRKQLVVPIVAITLTVMVNFSGGVKQTSGEGYQVLYQSEGILGQVKVVDLNYLTQTRGWKNGRALLVNNTGQTIMDIEKSQYSLWDWAYFFPMAASIFPAQSDALLLGLGGDTLEKQFRRLGFNMDIVVLD